MEKVTVDVLVEKQNEGSPKQDSKDETDIKALNDTELREQLSEYGISPGPILPSTRAIYEKKLLQFMKGCPAVAARQKGDDCVSDNGKDEEQGINTEVVLETNHLKVTAECASGADNKSHIDVAERQKKLLSPDVEYSLAKIVSELQELLPEGKVAAYRSQGQRRKASSSPERNHRQMKSDIPHEDYGYPEANAGQSTRRRSTKENPLSVKKGPEIKSQVVPEQQDEGFIPMRVKMAVFAIFVFILFVYVTMETNRDNPFIAFISGI
ncbi:LEM domain-containing protein 1 [Heteronotia binoei]|uniref:LEM domain-containing protein 1 n=1 Tax=Heteronotia binoei TaxID=13085 RepID=UPI002931CF8C|nr:LEM domain-containing protein 1 [Heteronotia binoei]XP_060087298.1 LEM domain-containing protein 1 [Heteronotia binoei]XP_060087299.1 LEM domain-containing protein 1 [Heteronotia binoei]